MLPDGRMETTWKLKPSARWHDGTPLTAADLVFTLQAGPDKDIPLTTYPGYRSIEGIDPVDDARSPCVGGALHRGRYTLPATISCLRCPGTCWNPPISPTSRRL